SSTIWGRIHNIHQRSGSPLNLPKDDLSLGNLKFVPKGETDEVFGMQIPKELITDNIRNAPYYNAYLEMVAKHDKKIAAEEGGKKKAASKVDQYKKPTTAKQPKPVPSKQSKPAPTTKPKVTQEKPSEPSPAKHPKRALVGGVAIREQVEEATRQLPVFEGKGKAISTDEQAAQSLLALHTSKRRSITDQFIFQRQTPKTEEASTGPSEQPQDDASAIIVRDSSSPVNAETGADTDITTSTINTEVLYAEDVQGEEISHTMVIEEKTVELDKGQDGSDPSKTPESRPPPEHEQINEDQAGPNLGQSHEALAGPNPEPMHDDFIATV
ncbi:hypothetical protein Tco_0711402, partial [Tanacetum coccineum]